MSDPLSISAGVVGITSVALHGARLLLEDIRLLNDAPKTIKSLQEDVLSMDVALKSVQSVEESEWETLGKEVVELSEMTISNCAQACKLFRDDIQRWTKHSEDGKIEWRDRASVGFFKRGQIKAMSQQLANYKLTINYVVSIATFHSSIRNSHVTEDIKKMMDVKQAEVKNAITTTNKQLVGVEIKLEELDLSSDGDLPAESSKDETEGLRRQLEDELSSVKTSLKLLKELLSMAQEEAVAKIAKNQMPASTVTFGNNNSGLQAHTINGGVGGWNIGGNLVLSQFSQLVMASA